MATFFRQSLRKTSDLLFSGNRATIDAIRLAPPPSPLAPVNLSDPVKVHSVMDLAARIGDLLLSAGTGNSDAKAQIRGIMGAYGLQYTHVDITLNTINVYARFSDEHPPTNVFRVVRQLSTDFSRVTEVDRLVRSIHHGATPLEQAQKILFEIETSPLPYRNRYALLSWGGFAASVAFLLGGGWAVAVVAGLTTIFTMFANAWLASKSLPLFFQNILGGFAAVIPAAVTFAVADAVDLYLPPSLIIGSSIVALLAGLTLVQALQDGITGAPVTSAARFYETLLQTGGIITGIAGGIQTAMALGITLPPIDTSQTAGAFGNVPIQIISGALATAFFCGACFCERRAMTIASLTALIASIMFFGIQEIWGGSYVMADAAAALMVGLAGGLLSRRYMIPPQITAAAGITPFLPGLALYRGMSSLLNDQFVVGMSNLGLALTTATSLAAGVVLGEWVARRIRRPRIIHRYNQLRRPKAARRPTGEQGPRLGTDGRVRQPLHWRRRQRKSAKSPWQLDSNMRETEAKD
ncbi:MAG TPA: threonine/serine exporter family protein [Candidatus Corynebacterium gallistercoris]|uniref:Threonine/serine exporter family protein n=1 Tax=Candidatus Corynebacterium gallistercoris TaxID=2838530 RepID=A0A9D1RYS7_9CORY|nr:threonine/serine exporter family protein [Candidatus Corynebacterium gallistercoris]